MRSNRSLHNATATPLPASIAFADSGVGAPRVVVEVIEPITRDRLTSISVTLELPPSAFAIAAASPTPVQVRASFPGCHVSPAEVILDAVHRPSSTFCLAPVSQQPYLEGHLEVSVEGLTVQNLPVRLRTNRSRLMTGLVLALFAAPILWWWVSALDGPAVSTAIRAHVPALGGIANALANAFRWVVERTAALEHSFRFGFWLGVILTVVALATRWRLRLRTRKIAGEPLPNLFPTPSARMRPLPPYLTPVSSEELGHSGR